MAVWARAAVVAAIAVAAAAFLLALDLRPIAGRADADDTAYNLVDVSSPTLHGPALQWFAWLATATPLRAVVPRILLNQNAMHEVRELAASLPDWPPLHYPMERLTPADRAEHEAAAAREPTTASVLRDGLGGRSQVERFHALYKSGRAKPSQVLAKLLVRASELDTALGGIFAALDHDDVMRQAVASDRRWARAAPLSVLDGVPVTIKEMVHVLGYAIAEGGTKPVNSTADDPAVARLRAAGAIIFGTTVMTEGGVTPLGYNVHSKGPRNAFNLSYYPGGSSSGAAVSVATGLVPFALGFDGGGSIRLPAAMSGLFGLAATFGRIPFGGEALAFTTIKSGPLAASAADAAIAHAVLSPTAGPDHFYSRMYDGGAQGVPPSRLDGFADVDSLKGMRVGVFWDHFRDADHEVVAAAQRALDSLVARGAQIVPIAIPHLRELSISHSMKILSEFALFWEARFYNSSVLMEPNTRITVMLGKSLSAIEVVAGERLRSWGKAKLRAIFREHRLDAIASPSMGVRVPQIPVGATDTGESNNMLTFRVMMFVSLANFLGLPGMSVPVSFDSNGLPIGFHLMGDAWMEHKILRLANSLEHHHVEKRRPPSPYFVDPLAEWAE